MSMDTISATSVPVPVPKKTAVEVTVPRLPPTATAMANRPPKPSQKLTSSDLPPSRGVIEVLVKIGAIGATGVLDLKSTEIELSLGTVWEWIGSSEGWKVLFGCGIVYSAVVLCSVF